MIFILGVTMLELFINIESINGSTYVLYKAFKYVMLVLSNILRLLFIFVTKLTFTKFAHVVILMH